MAFLRTKDGHRLLLLAPDINVIFLDLANVILAHEPISGWNAILRRALEYRQVLHIRRDGGDDLDPRRTRSDYADPLVLPARIFRPARGVNDLARKGFDPFDGRKIGLRKQAKGRNDKPRAYSLAVCQLHAPALCIAIPGSTGHLGCK